MAKLACITCGPAYEPIDEVRRITNFSTGEIGAVLAKAFLASGYDVACFRGSGSVYPAPAGADVRPFTTNASLEDGIRALARKPDVLLHAAALCDFALDGIEGAEGSGKISSRAGAVKLTLKPAPKLLPRFRGWFPEARIVGWKFEIEGDRARAITRAADQIRECRTDACVVNGSAYGPGFGLVLPDGSLRHFPDKAALAGYLAMPV